MAVATIEADEAVASSVFVQIMGTSLKKMLVRVILVNFGHFASSDFKVWLRWCIASHLKRIWRRIIHIYMPYFFKYSPCLESNPVSNWTQVNLLIQTEVFLKSLVKFWFETGWLWTMKSIKPWGLNLGFMVYIYSPDYLLSSVDCNYTPGIGTLFPILISSGEKSALVHFTAATANHYNFVFIIRSFCCTWYPSPLSRQRQYGIRSLPDTPIHDQQWKIKTLDLSILSPLGIKEFVQP